MTRITSELTQALKDLQEEANLVEGDILIIGTSTSEVIGKHIGTESTEEVAKLLWKTLEQFSKSRDVNLAFQCCEHLNRAIVVERDLARKKDLEIVTAVPTPSAGGAMATEAYKKMADPVLVESIQADAGIDIGDTFIGMHLKKVVVPVRSKVNKIGEAHFTMARTRPKLIGGERAVYHS